MTAAATGLPGHRLRSHTRADHFEEDHAFPAEISLRLGEGAPARLILPVRLRP